MAREKTKVRYQPYPKEAPDGMEFVEVKRTIGKNPDSVIRVLVPKANGAGVGAAAKYLSSILPAEGGDGTVFCAEAIRNAIVTSQVAQHTGLDAGGDVGKVGTTVPRIASLKIVDKAAAAGAAVQKYINDHPGTPTQDELTKAMREIYSSLSL